MRITLESLKAPAVSSLAEIWSDELDETFGVQGLSLEEDFDWRKVVPYTKIDNLTANIYDGLVIAATYDESVWESMKGQWKNWVLEKSLNNDNFKQMYESLKNKGIDITNLESIIESIVDNSSRTNRILFLIQF